MDAEGWDFKPHHRGGYKIFLPKNKSIQVKTGDGWVQDLTQFSAHWNEEDNIIYLCTQSGAKLTAESCLNILKAMPAELRRRIYPKDSPTAGKSAHG